MTRKRHVRFGGGPTEKARQRDLAGGLPYNLAEVLAAELIARHFPQRFDFDEPVVWLEHYPAFQDRTSGKRNRPQFDRVTFASWTPRKIWLGRQERIALGEPEWKHLPLPEVAALIGPHELDDQTHPIG